jgi:hypothetical protein
VDLNKRISAPIHVERACPQATYPSAYRSVYYKSVRKAISRLDQDR